MGTVLGLALLLVLAVLAPSDLFSRFHLRLLDSVLASRSSARSAS